MWRLDAVGGFDVSVRGGNVYVGGPLLYFALTRICASWKQRMRRRSLLLVFFALIHVASMIKGSTHPNIINGMLVSAECRTVQGCLKSSCRYVLTHLDKLGSRKEI